MKALGILGTSSSAGKSWMTTAFCAWLRRQGVQVAPFKAQNMSNNGWVTPHGEEIARAQAVQAEAAGIEPDVSMNPILLKPSGEHGSQLVLMGKAVGHFEALKYYRDIETLWQTVANTLDSWKDRCDVLVLEGAGSPVELNLMTRDLVNLRPIRHLGGRWVLVGDIDRGGIFAQFAGTWNLLPEPDRHLGLGAIANRFRGDIRLFKNPNDYLDAHAPGFPILGTVPLRRDLQPEEEDGLRPDDEDRGSGDTMAWIRLPHAANLTDCQPWWDDEGVRLRWTSDANVISNARAIVIPGTKNTIADMRWLRETGLAQAIVQAAKNGTPLIGICGGYQMLGEHLVDEAGVAGDSGEVPGLGLLPTSTEFFLPKIVREIRAECDGDSWKAYEIHVGRTKITGPCDPYHAEIDPEAGSMRPKSARLANVMGTYLHGWFESPKLRSRIAAELGFAHHRAHPVPWAKKRREIYDAMADHLVEHVDLDSVRMYIGI